ncbi:hypothetical protein SNE40_000763 [Patella caerulea]|uniref:BTB domain-containing protein n=1 Tax=Patella caerulea TaxID=87958 RepID=A0AAN8KM31_PATCE
MSDMQMNGFHGEELLIQDENFPVHLMSRLNKLREGVKFCDVTLVVGQHDVPAHKCILVSCSPYLFDLFSQEEKSGVTRGTCKLKGIEFTSFEYLLNYMYTGTMVIPAEEVKNVYGTARKLKMEEVAKQCVAFLADNLTPANCLGIRSYAQDVEMKKKVDEYIKVNFNDVIVSKNFYGLPNLQVEVVGADEDLLESSQQSHLFELLLIYVKEHQNTKKFKLERLIEQLNVLYLTRDNTLQDCKDFEDKSLKEDEGVQDYRKLKRKQHGHIKANQNKDGQTSETNNNQVNSLPFQKFTIVKDKSVLEREWKIIAFKETADNTYISISIFNGCLTTISLHCRVARQSPSNSISDTPDSPVHSVSDVQFERSRSLTPLKSMSTPRCGFGLRAVGDILIASGGYDRGECMKSTECFDIESNTWRILADMNTARGRFSTARMGNMIYACGGSNGLQELRSVEVYDPEKDLWSFVAPMSKDRSSPGCAVLNDKLYCIGGCMGQDSIAGCEVYDPKTDSWSDIAPLQTARYQASVRAYQGKLYVMGGTDGWHCLKSVEVYDTETNEWKFIESLNVSRRGAGVESYQGKLFVIGGNDGVTSLKSTEILDVENAVWKFGPALTSPRSNAGSAVHGKRLFAVGGFNGKKFLDTMEYLDDTQEWSHYAPVSKIRNSNSLESVHSEDSALVKFDATSTVMDDPIH